MTAQLVKIQTSPDLVEQVYRSLLDAISVGSLAPGQRITQEDIAERLAVSRQPVLQALRLLKKDGFVQDAPGRGLQVTPLDAQWTLHVYQVRGALDTLAARLAAQQRFCIDARIMDAGRKAARGRNVQAMIDADLAFHDAIYAASGNPLIAQSAQQHWRHLRRVMGAVLREERQRGPVWDEHDAIAHAIADGDADLAADLTEQHAQHAADNLARRLTHVLPLQTQGDPR